MKKWIYVILVLIIIGLISLFIIRESKRNKKDISVYFVDELSEEKLEKIDFCAIDSDGNFNLVKIDVPLNIDDVYTYVFELYNLKRNTLPIGYEVVTNQLLEYNSIKVEDEKIIIDLKDVELTKEEKHKLLLSLKITYKYLGIKDVIVTINNIPIL